MLNLDELLIVENSLKDIFDSELEHILSKLNRSEDLQTFLKLIGYEDIYPEYKRRKRENGSGKIVIIAGTEIKEIEFYKVADSLDIDRNRLELCLDYKDASKFDYKKMQYNDNYSLILFGQTPHSGHEKGVYGSVVSALENEPGYPEVYRLGSNDLKISKTNFKDALQKAILDGVIVVG